MKKSLILKLVLTAVLVFTFTGCGSDQEVDSSSSEPNIQEELSAETPDDGMSADKEDVSGTPDQDKEDTSSVASSGGADKTSKPADSDAKPSGGSNNSADTGNTGNSGSDSGNTNSDAGAAQGTFQIHRAVLYRKERIFSDRCDRSPFCRSVFAELHGRRRRRAVKLQRFYCIYIQGERTGEGSRR